MMDTYSSMTKQAQCAECGKFMPWGRSRLVEKGDGFPSPSPVLIERGVCRNCEDCNEREKRLHPTTNQERTDG